MYLIVPVYNLKMNVLSTLLDQFDIINNFISYNPDFSINSTSIAVDRVPTRSYYIGYFPSLILFISCFYQAF